MWFLPLTCCGGIGQALQSVVLSVGISTSGMKPGLCGLTWARRTADGRFWMPPPRREAKVTPCWPTDGPLFWVWLYITAFQFFIVVKRGTEKSPESSLSLEGTMGLKQKYFPGRFLFLILLGSGCYLTECLACAHIAAITAAEAPAPARQQGKEAVLCQQ